MRLKELKKRISVEEYYSSFMRIIKFIDASLEGDKNNVIVMKVNKRHSKDVESHYDRSLNTFCYVKKTPFWNKENVFYITRKSNSHLLKYLKEEGVV